MKFFLHRSNSIIFTTKNFYENTCDMCKEYSIVVLSRILHRCRKSNPDKLLTLIQKSRHVNFSNLMMQKYELSRQTHKMTIVLRLKLYNILLYTARIAYENTYEMRGILTNYPPPFQNQVMLIFQI